LKWLEIKKEIQLFNNVPKFRFLLGPFFLTPNDPNQCHYTSQYANEYNAQHNKFPPFWEISPIHYIYRKFNKKTKGKRGILDFA